MTEDGRSCGEALVGLLEDYGCRVVFGIPGTHAIELYRGLAASGLEHVLTRHEQGAAFMANGYARISGKPGLCFLITGPGLTNAATPIAQAYSDSVPMLVVTPVNDRASLGRGWGRLHEITEQMAVSAPITAFSARAMTAEDIPGLVARAFDSFQGGRPRPVHIEVPIDLLREPAGGNWARSEGRTRPLADAEAVTRAAALLEGAERPAIVAGGGALGAAPHMASMAESLAAPVATTTAGKGVLPSGHPLSLGAALSLPATQDLLRSADVVLAIGTELSETDFWRNDFTFSGKLIRVDVDPAKLDDLFPPALAVHGDSADFAARLVAALGDGRAGQMAAARASVESVRATFADRLSAAERRHMTVLSALRAALPEDGLLVSDMTQIAYTACRHFPTERPGCHLHPSGYGTLGYALPTAIGAKLAAPARPVVALVGDAGLLYTVQEMATAAELGTNLVVLLWNNDALAQIRDDMVAAGYPPLAVEPRNPVYVDLARSFGWHAERAESLAGLGDILRAALERPGPSLIEVKDEGG